MSGQITTNAPVLQTLVQRLRAPLDQPSMERAQLHVLDWLGCAVKGVREPGATGFLSDANDSLSAKCRRLSRQGISLRTGWWDAVQTNAACGNIMEMDDLDRASILHPGPVIVPAAIAVAEHIGASGEQLLGAIVRGYEATIRIGGKTHGSHRVPRENHFQFEFGFFRERDGWICEDPGTHEGFH